ncbi:MAG: DUF3179 domain-containing protein [bacterium]|nr:DUF3179 domain-containing protein [bacterium]
MANTAVVYDRDVSSKTLNFEASGALMNASLVMRDRETDSWWSIMTSSAIGGELDGAELDELPVGEKTTWRDWRERYPETTVLSVDGQEHRLNNPYDNYFSSDKTFRDLQIADERLEPKTPVFSFWLEGRTYAAPHSAFEGGRLFGLPGDPSRKVLLYRDTGASIFASTRAWTVDSDYAAATGLDKLIAAARQTTVAGRPLEGFDTFWYSWISVNSDSKLLR